MIFQELIAVCYGCQWANIPVKEDHFEEKKKKAALYQALLRTSEGVLQDPFELQGWLDENDGKVKWPKIFLVDMTQYLLNQNDKDMGRRILSDYEVKGNSFSICNFWFIKNSKNFCITKT